MQFTSNTRHFLIGGGDFAKAVSRKFIYNLISERTGYSTRTIADILNHTTYTEITPFME